MSCPSLVKVVEWTVENGQNPHSLLDFLKIPESTAIRICLRKWETTGQGYDTTLKQSGWYELDDEPEDGDVAVVGGESIVTWNLATHLPRDLIQLLVIQGK